MNAKEVGNMLLGLSDQALDPIAKDLIRKWSDPPTPAQLLGTLDMCVSGSLCSSFEIKVMHFALAEACKRECVTFEEVRRELTKVGDK